jgi:hypothetical protein
MSIKTKLVGVTHKNEDGTSRQELLKDMREGERIVLAYEENNPKSDHAVAAYNSIGQKLGYLNDDLAIDLAEQIKELGVAINAEVLNITGGDGRKFGCNIEIPDVEELTEEEKEAIKTTIPTGTGGCIQVIIVMALFFAVIWYLGHSL